MCDLYKKFSSFSEIKVLQTSVLKRAVCAWKVTVLWFFNHGEHTQHWQTNKTKGETMLMNGRMWSQDKKEGKKKYKFKNGGIREWGEQH